MLSPVSDLADQLSRLPGPGGSNINNRRHSVANAGCARVITREAAVRDEEARVRQDHDKDGDVKMIDARPVAGPGNTQATVRRVSSFRAKLLTIQQRELRSCPQSSSPLHATATSSSRPLLLPVHFEYARALPVLAAFMLSGHVRAGDALEMPVPWPEAWEATLAWAYYCWPTVRPLHSDHEKDMAKAKMHVDVELETGVEEEEGKEKEEDRNEEGNEKDSMEEDGRKGEREKEGGKKEEGKEKGNVKETEEMVLFEKVRENVRYLCGVI